MRALPSGWIVLSGMMCPEPITISDVALRLRMDIPNRIVGQAARTRSAGSSRTLRIGGTGCGCGSGPRPMAAAPCQSRNNEPRQVARIAAKERRERKKRNADAGVQTLALTPPAFLMQSRTGIVRHSRNQTDNGHRIKRRGLRAAKPQPIPLPESVARPVSQGDWQGNVGQWNENPALNGVLKIFSNCNDVGR